MKKNRNFSLLLVAHGLLSSALAIVVIGLSSCFEAEPDALNFGPENSAQSIADALNASFSGLNPETIQTGEFVHIETNQAVAGGTKFVTKDTGISVLSRVDNGSTLTFTLAVEEIVYDSSGGSQRSVFEESIDITKAGASSFSAMTQVLSALKSKKLHASEAVPLCEPVLSDSVTYHRLNSQSGSLSVPTSVQSTDFCTGKDPCVVSATTVTFDQVVWSGDEGDKIKCEYTYSTAVPYLAAELRRCITLAVPVEDRSVLLTECSEVLNFEEGS